MMMTWVRALGIIDEAKKGGDNYFNGSIYEEDMLDMFRRDGFSEKETKVLMACLVLAGADFAEREKEIFCYTICWEDDTATWGFVRAEDEGLAKKALVKGYEIDADRVSVYKDDELLAGEFHSQDFDIDGIYEIGFGA